MARRVATYTLARFLEARLLTIDENCISETTKRQTPREKSHGAGALKGWVYVATVFYQSPTRAASYFRKIFTKSARNGGGRVICLFR